ncbi:MAG: DUF2062 domain-containing protein [Paracoccaceae bacterium]
MILKRRDKQSLFQRLRALLFPGKGWNRSLKYVGHRIKRLPDTSHKIALGAAIGTFVCFSPILGVHMAMALILVYILRANLIAAFITTVFGNPVTYPFIAAVSLSLGRVVLGQNAKDDDFQRLHTTFWNAFTDFWQLIKSWFGAAERPDGLGDFFTNMFLPYLVGGTIIGLVLGAAIYFLLKPAISAYQYRRRVAVDEMREKRRSERDSEADSSA